MLPPPLSALLCLQPRRPSLQPTFSLDCLSAYSSPRHCQPRLTSQFSLCLGNPLPSCDPSTSMSSSLMLSQTRSSGPELPPPLPLTSRDCSSHKPPRPAWMHHTDMRLHSHAEVCHPHLTLPCSQVDLPSWSPLLHSTSCLKLHPPLLHCDPLTSGLSDGTLHPNLHCCLTNPTTGLDPEHHYMTPPSASLRCHSLSCPSLSLSPPSPCFPLCPETSSLAPCRPLKAGGYTVFELLIQPSGEMLQLFSSFSS